MPSHDIADAIRRGGPWTVERYMRACLTDRGGRYAEGNPIGAAGDFITAPEISQLFGETIAVWIAAAFEGLGRPAQLRLVELGPGRGTLMADALRLLRRVPEVGNALDVHLVERSLPLRREQAARVAWPRLAWHDDVADVPAGPAIVIGNEFLDCLPIAQAICDGAGWRERLVAWSGGRLVFATGDAVPGPADARIGAVREYCPSHAALLAALAARAAPFAALFVDYGHAGGYGDTLQAVSRHRHADPLATPGAADLSAHVDFAALARAAVAAGLVAHGPLPQGQLLLRLGIAARRDAHLRASPQPREAIDAAVARLVDPAQMGDLFKAMAITSPGQLTPLPF